MADERVALYDDRGEPCGSAPRARMRAENLRHAATAVVVRDHLGRVYVHRRTPTKDVYPGRRDFAAGGVVDAGERPESAAVRELAEELGITDVPLTWLGSGPYEDDHTRYHGFCWSAEWDGPIRWQPEEVEGGEWMTVDDLLAAIGTDPDDFMPDTVGLLGPWLRERAADRRTPPQGWDTYAEILEERWLERVPRRDDVVPRLRAEVELLAGLAGRLPLEVPEPSVVAERPLRLRHVLVAGEPCRPEALSSADGVLVGRFLRALHDTPTSLWAGVPPAGVTARELMDSVDDWRHRVLPLLPDSARPAAEGLLSEAADDATTSDTTLVHGDLGPEHLLVRDGRVSGVIDWCDARVHDPALDLAWVLHGTPAGFADAVASTYGLTPELLRRSLVRRRLGPWYEVTYGIDVSGPDHVASGVAGIMARLP